MALSDWFNPHVIHKIERQAGRIRVWASVDVMVTSVQVMILDEQGKVVGKGEAVKGKGDWWEYVPGAEGKVVVEARDLAENVERGGERLTTKEHEDFHLPRPRKATRTTAR